MANLRTNNLCGEGGRRAYRGSVYFDGKASVTGLQVIAADSNDDFTLGTGDFALEMWIFTGVSQSATLYDGRKGSASHVTPHIDLSSNVVRYLTAGTARITGSSTLSLNSWHHISVERASGSTKLYVNGVQEGSTYSDSNSYVAKLNRPLIGAADGYNSVFNGYISNVRLCKGHTVYGEAFSPPTSELVVHDKTVLLCCQDSDDPLQEATGKEMLGQGGVYFGKRFSNLATNGDLETGDTTNWNNGGLGTFEVSNFSHSGSYSLHCVSNSNGDACSYVIPVTLDVEKRYKISAYIYVAGPLGTTARAKMKIGSGTGGNENYESEVVGQTTPQRQWSYVEWIGMATADTTHVTFNESSANDVNDYYVDDLRIELWYPEEGVNILGNNRFKDGATGWAFNSGNSPSTEWSIASNKLSVTDTSRTNDAIASQTLFYNSIKEGRYLLTMDYSVSSGDFDVGIGNGRLYGIANTHNGGNGAAGTFTTFLDPSDGNSSFRIVANQYCVADFFSVHLSRVPEPKAPKIIPPYGTDAGNTFDGAISMNSSSYMYFPTGRTEEKGRGRGFYMLGYHGTPGASPGKRIDYVNIQSQGNSITFGNLTANRYTMGAGASSTRGLFTGGYVEGNSPDTDVNIIEFITIATEGDAIDFGDRTQVGRVPACASNDTRCVMASAFTPSGYQNTIDFVTIASIGNASNFGDLSSARAGMSMSCNSTTRGIFNGGYAPSPLTARLNTMEYITFATTGNVTDFGDLTDDSQSTTGGTASSSTRGLIGLGYVHPTRSNAVDFCTIATTGNAQDFGDLTAAKQSYGSCSNSTRGLFFGGQTPTYINNIDMVIISTTGDATDFGDVTIGVTAIGAAGSDSHGGLS